MSDSLARPLAAGDHRIDLRIEAVPSVPEPLGAVDHHCRN